MSCHDPALLAEGSGGGTVPGRWQVWPVQGMPPRCTAANWQPERRKTRPLGLGAWLEQRWDQGPPRRALQAQWLGLQRH